MPTRFNSCGMNLSKLFWSVTVLQMGGVGWAGLRGGVRRGGSTWTESQYGRWPEGLGRTT